MTKFGWQYISKLHDRNSRLKMLDYRTYLGELKSWDRCFKLAPAPIFD